MVADIATRAISRAISLFFFILMVVSRLGKYNFTWLVVECQIVGSWPFCM